MLNTTNSSTVRTAPNSFNRVQSTDKSLSEAAADALQLGSLINSHIQSKNYKSDTTEGTFSKKEINPIHENITNNRELSEQATSCAPSPKYSVLMTDDSRRDLFQKVPEAFLRKTIAKDQASPEKTYYGNCGEKAFDALNHIAKKFPAYETKVELVTIKDKGTGYDHAFLILNRNQQIPLSLDPTTWGDDVVICDPHAQMTCLAKDYKQNNFKVYTSHKNQWKEGLIINGYELFEPNDSRFQIDVQKDSSAMKTLVDFHRPEGHKQELKALLKASREAWDKKYAPWKEASTQESHPTVADTGLSSFFDGRLESMDGDDRRNAVLKEAIANNNIALIQDTLKEFISEEDASLYSVPDDVYKQVHELSQKPGNSQLASFIESNTGLKKCIDEAL